MKRSFAYATETSSAVSTDPSDSAAISACARYQAWAERSLLFYAGWAYADKPDEFALAASAARSVGGRALDYAARELISVHGGIGATWEHDAPLFFRRAQLTRRLLGGTAGATDRVAGELLSAA